MLLLCSDLGDPKAHPISLGRFRQLRALVNANEAADPERDLRPADLMRLGCPATEAHHIASLLAREDLLARYLARAATRGIFPVTRLSPAYPQKLIETLGDRCPPVLFCAGDPALFQTDCIALVGSRALAAPGQEFAAAVGRYAAAHGCTLVSGGAQGADATAQNAALDADGAVLVYLAASLWKAVSQQPLREKLLLCSERGYEQDFSVLRASARNRMIHAMAVRTYVAQTDLGRGGTFTGTAENLRHRWSPVFVHDDGSAGAAELIRRGAAPVSLSALTC